MNPSVATSRLDVPIPISPENHYAQRGCKRSDKKDNMPTFRYWIGLRICINSEGTVKSTDFQEVPLIEMPAKSLILRAD